jgi:hypothetical protein
MSCSDSDSTDFSSQHIGNSNSNNNKNNKNDAKQEQTVISHKSSFAKKWKKIKKYQRKLDQISGNPSEYIKMKTSSYHKRLGKLIVQLDDSVEVLLDHPECEGKCEHVSDTQFVVNWLQTPLKRLCAKCGQYYYSLL